MPVFTALAILGFNSVDYEMRFLSLLGPTQVILEINALIIIIIFSTIVKLLLNNKLIRTENSVMPPDKMHK